MSFKFNRGCWVESEEDAWNVMVEGQFLEEGADAFGTREMMTIERRIALARVLMEKFGRRLLSQPPIQSLLTRLLKGISRSQDTMVELGIPESCAGCDAQTPEGSCCSTGLESKCDVTLLVINLLLGTDIRGSRGREGSCFFLGGQGCTLKARHMLCIDYLCPALEERLGHEKLVRMQAATGEEIEALFLLQGAVAAMISRWLQELR